MTAQQEKFRNQTLNFLLLGFLVSLAHRCSSVAVIFTVHNPESCLTIALNSAHVILSFIGLSYKISSISSIVATVIYCYVLVFIFKSLN